MEKHSIRYINQKSSSGNVDSSVAYPNMPKYIYAQSFLEKFNKVLGFILFILVLLALVSYYFVSDNEKTMNKLGREIVDLTNDNIELQNKIDNMHSFNKVDEFIKSKSNLKAAKNIIEIPAVYKGTEPDIKPIEVRYKWTTGY